MTLPSSHGGPITMSMTDSPETVRRPLPEDGASLPAGATASEIGIMALVSRACGRISGLQRRDDILDAVHEFGRSAAGDGSEFDPSGQDTAEGRIPFPLRDCLGVDHAVLSVPEGVPQAVHQALGIVTSHAGAMLGCMAMQSSSMHDISARQVAEFEVDRLRMLFDRRLEEALGERSIWADVFRGSQYGVCIVGTDLRYLSFNPAFEGWFAMHRAPAPRQGERVCEVLGHRPEVMVEAEACWRRALAGEDFSHHWHIASDGRDFHYETRYTPLLEEDGSVKGAVQFTLDITDRIMERRRLEIAETALRQSQKMEAVGKLTGGIAHDFNNILTGIVGAIDIIGRKMSEGRTEAVPRYLDMAATSANRAASLTHRLLAFSRRQPVDPRLTDVEALVLGMGEMISRAMGPDIAVETSTSGSSARVLCDASQLESAIMNLIVNGREAMPTGGRLLIATGTVELDTAPAGEDVQTGLFMRLAVSDNGTGMTAEVLSRAIEPFYTTKGIGNGTGLGLSMVYGFARQTGGFLDIHSEEAEGTTVSIFLPATAVSPIVEEREPACPKEMRHDATVLVVEDEPAVRAIVVELLEEMGCRVLQAEDGGVGAAILSSDARIDVLVTDIGLPVLNGRQVATAARSARPDIPILFMTGYSDNAAITEGFAGHTTLVTKPFRPAQIADAVERLLG